MPVSAQFDLPNLNLAPTLSLTADPITPLPNSAITVTASLSGITNVNNSNYAWFLNGVKQTNASGLNKNAFAVRAGVLGTIYRIGVTISTPAGDNLSDSVSVTVSDIDLTWNSNNEAPVGYSAKIFPTQDSVVSISAFSSIYNPGTKTLLGSNGLIYNWYVNDKFSVNLSGLGKQDFGFIIGDPAGGNTSIQLDVKNESGVIALTKSITIPISRPQILVYLADSKTSIPIGAAIKNIVINTAKLLNFTAQSYFFNTPNNQLKLNWIINNQIVSGRTNSPWLASFDVPANIVRPFNALIQVTAQNPNKLSEIDTVNINFQMQ
jgi:hypothetical protein